MNNNKFPNQKREIFYKSKEIKVLGGDVPYKYVAQLTPQIDDEIVLSGTRPNGVGLSPRRGQSQKGRFWMETD